jgi:hypothetical protein
MKFCITAIFVITDFGIAMGYGMDGWDLIPSRGKIFLYSTTPRLALGPAQLPIQWIWGLLSQGVKWLGREADNSPPSHAKIKNGGVILPLPLVFMA